MRFEQPEGLRSVTAEPQRLTWSYRWKVLRTLLPLLLLSTLLVLEFLLFQIWSRSEWNALKVDVLWFANEFFIRVVHTGLAAGAVRIWMTHEPCFCWLRACRSPS